MKQIALAVLLLLVSTSAYANDPQGGAAKSYFANLTLTDQDGRRVRLYEDLMKGHTVVVNSFFASCNGSCPVMARTFLHIQNKLGDRIGDDVILISITVDPETDTPAKLKAYAERMGAKKGWYFLTGTPEEVDAALNKIGQYTEVREGHKNVIVAGNDRTGLWKKAFGLASSEEVYKVIASVADDPGATPAPAAGK